LWCRDLNSLLDVRPPHNLRPRFNVCPTDPIDVVTEQHGKRDFVRMRWG
jgi:putative SOS response-associated peptidase YedK